MAARYPTETERRAGEAIGFGGPRPASPPPAMVASDWVPRQSNTLRGFIRLRLRSGLILPDCTYHVQGDRRWIGLPGKAQIDREGRQRTDPATGKKLYTPAVEIELARREQFQIDALAAVDELLAGEGVR